MLDLSARPKLCLLFLQFKKVTSTNNKLIQPSRVVLVLDNSAMWLVQVVLENISACDGDVSAHTRDTR